VRALLTTAVLANAILPAVPVENAPVGMMVIYPPVVAIPVGGVIVVISVVPDTNTMGLTGAIVVALAIAAGATDPVTGTPKVWVATVAELPMTVVLVPRLCAR